MSEEFKHLPTPRRGGSETRLLDDEDIAHARRIRRVAVAFFAIFVLAESPYLLDWFSGTTIAKVALGGANRSQPRRRDPGRAIDEPAPGRTP